MKIYILKKKNKMMQESGAPNKLYFFPFLQKEDLTILYKILNERNLKIRNNSLSKIKKNNQFIFLSGS